MSRFIDADRIDWRLIIPTNVTIAEENIIHMAKKLVERQPTVDVVEVVHGKWIPSRFKTLQEDGWCECSVCGVGNKLYDRGVRKSDIPYIDGKPYELKNIANYCPNCGAKMERRKQ